MPKISLSEARARLDALEAEARELGILPPIRRSGPPASRSAPKARGGHAERVAAILERVKRRIRERRAQRWL
jgi:hypothetical protein